MLELQKTFLLVRFFNQISCNEGLKAKISPFFCVFSVSPPPPPNWGWNVLEAERPIRFWCHIGWRYTKICIHEASQMEWKRSKCRKLPILEGKLSFYQLSEWNEYNQYVLKLFVILALFTASFYHFLCWRYSNSSMTRFSSDILLPFPNSNDLNSCGAAGHAEDFQIHVLEWP